ncbi:X-ray repair cross-complementing protein 6 [Calliopsis andreniformis]|uniref:X-ray repair cross-complementing protein 6 n=1 Tax=Calliopsis andreniformis TaxID=337506 RepID=UPI003FCC63D3
MTSFMDDEFESQEDIEEDPKELYGIRDGILFIIDATPPMFENDPKEGIPYFLQCIRKYKDILKEKLVWNRQDWMGLILFGTEKWDTDSETKYVKTLQKLKLVAIDDLKEIMKIDEGKKWEYYKDNASSMVYPLHDVLWYAARAFSSINITMPMRKVLLFTCQDNPPLTNKDEQHRIRVQVASYSDTGLQLSIIGLGKNWNHDIFYKDLEILSEKVDSEDYERESLEDLLAQVKLPSRNMARLPWRLGGNVIVDVAIRNISVKTQSVKKVSMSKASNVPLTPYRYLVQKEEENEENSLSVTPIFETDIKKCQKFGGREIYFTQDEVKTFKKTRSPGIDLICVKPIFCSPLYHFGSPYFVTPSKSNRQDNKLLFGALLNKCDSRDLMIVCAVTIRECSATNLFAMIPSAKTGGFYLYKIPFKENVRQINEKCKEYIYDQDNHKPPSDPNGIEVLEKIIEKLTIEYNPDLFPNPKLQVQLQNIETLALDFEPQDPPPDNTLRDPNEMRELIKDLLIKYHEIFQVTECTDAPPKKKAKKADDTGRAPIVFYTEEKIRNIAEKRELNSYTALQLKEMLKTLSLKMSGKKDELVNRILDYYK